MSQLDELLSRSRAPGAFVERKRFSLSREKAVEKLREFTLRNPRQYVLELVQSAVFFGASYIAIDVDEERMFLAWVGSKPIEADKLETIFDYLFANRGDMDSRPLVQLAIGLNAILQRKPKVLRIESGDGTVAGSVRMDLDRKGNGTLGRPAEPMAGTYVLAEFGANWLQRFQGKSWTPEEGLVESNCRYTPVPILLNGRAPFGWKASRTLKWFGTEGHLSFDADNRRGVVAFPTGDERNRRRGFELVVGGVRITQALLPELGTLPPPASGGPPRSLTGILCDDSLRKTADQSDIVRDQCFTRMLHAVQPTATELLKTVAGGSYAPPALPAVAAEGPTLGAGPAPEPLPEFLGQLGPRSALSLDELRLLPDGAPCFAVAPDLADALRTPCDPSRFPYPVLLLTPGQVETLDGKAPHLAVHRLGSAADIDFVRRALDQRVLSREVSLPPTEFLPGSVTLRVVLNGPRQAWGSPAEGDVPVRISHKGQTLWCALLPLGLPGLCVSLELTEPLERISDALREALIDCAIRESWRLLALQESPRERDGLRHFATGLLAVHLRPHFVRHVPDSTRLAIHLPVGWGNARETLQTMVLAQTRQGPLTLDRWVALMETRECLEIDSLDDLTRLEPLEERLGFGRLHAPALTGLLCAVEHRSGAWRQAASPQWADPEVTEVLALGLTFAGAPVAQLPPDWVRVGAPGLVVHLRRAAASAVDALPGMALLHRRLAHRSPASIAQELCPDGVALARVESAVRLGRMDLAAALGTLEDEELLTMAATGASCALRTAREWPDFAVSPRHGAALDEHHTALLSLDELRLLEALPLPAPRLRFDDPPEVWQALADADPEHWLLRTEVRIPGLRGWLGLRIPFDPTSGVFLQGSQSLTALTELDREVPVHGLLWSTGSSTALTRQQQELLALARQQLYQDFSAMVSQRLEPGAHAALRDYAWAYANHAWSQASGSLQGTARLLAESVWVVDDAGKPWGTVMRALQADPGHRPAHLQSQAHATRLPAPDVSATHWMMSTGGIKKRFDHLADRLRSAAGDAFGVSWLVYRPQDGWRTDSLVQVTDAKAPRHAQILLFLPPGLAASLESGNVRAAEVLLLATLPALVAWGERHGHALDLLDMQRVLTAQRLGSA